MQGRVTVWELATGLVGAALVAACGTAVPRQAPGPKVNPTRATTTSSVCGAAQVSGQFWIDPPGMSKAVEGITFTNTSSTSCSLPGFPKAFVLEDSSGNAVPAVALSSLVAGTPVSDADFVDSASVPAADLPSIFGNLPTRGVTLGPGAKAVIAMFGVDAILGPDQPGCLAAKSGDQLAVDLTGDQATTVNIPSNPGLWGPGDPSGSALFTCSALLVLPVLTWSRAKSVVGPASSAVINSPQLYGAAP